MKKIFSLICLFTITFFGMFGLVSAGTNVGLEELLELYEEKLNSSPVLPTGNEYAVTYDEESSKVYVEIVTAGYDQEEGIIVEYSYDRDENSLSYIKPTSPATYDTVIEFLFMSVLELHSFNTEYYQYITDDLLLSLNFEDHGFEMKQDDSNYITDYKISLDMDFPIKLTEEIEKSINSGGYEDPTTKPTTSSSTSSSTTEKPANNPSTSDMTIGNIIIIGGSLLLITGYSVLKIKKMKKEGLN